MTTTFPDFARSLGLEPPHGFVADDRVHRCRTTTHLRKRDGAYRWDGSWGWAMDWSVHTSPVLWRDAKPPAQVPPRKAPFREIENRLQAEARAADIVRNAMLSIGHPYLTRKGFPKQPTLVDEEDRLVVPMRSFANANRIQSVQWITASGDKKFMPRGKAGGAVFVIGPHNAQETWLVEGYATGLSVKEAADKLYRKARVLVCFSAGNLARIAPLVTGAAYVVADNDASGTGERVARESGLPWVMPPDVGTDANDLHQRGGPFALTALMREARPP